MTDEPTEEEKKAENERVDALQEKQEKNKQRRKKKVVIETPEGVRCAPGDDRILCVTIKKIALENYEMSDVGENVMVPREFARLLQESGAVRVVI